MWKAHRLFCVYFFLQRIYVIFFICINLRQPIFKIHVKILVPEIYSPSRGEVYMYLYRPATESTFLHISWATLGWNLSRPSGPTSVSLSSTQGEP